MPDFPLLPSQRPHSVPDIIDISPNNRTISLKSILLFAFMSNAVTGSFAVIQSI